MPCNLVTIQSNRQVAPQVFAMTVPWQGAVEAGQFFMLRDPHGAVLLPRAISVCDVREGSLLFCYQVVGRGTGGFARMGAGDHIQLTGPLGKGFPLEEPAGKIALVGGGIGVAPLVYTARQLRERGRTADAFLGFREDTFLLREMGEWVDSLRFSTESGKSGEKGLVTGLFDAKDYGAVFCCGPEPMMKAVTRLCQAADTPVYVSLENKMACGIGGCLVCTCTDKQGNNHRTCVDGPVFPGEEINFDA